MKYIVEFPDGTTVPLRTGDLAGSNVVIYLDGQRDKPLMLIDCTDKAVEAGHWPANDEWVVGVSVDPFNPYPEEER